MDLSPDRTKRLAFYQAKSQAADDLAATGDRDGAICLLREQRDLAQAAGDEDYRLLQVNKIKMNSKVAALDSLARILGMFKEDTDSVMVFEVGGDQIKRCDLCASKFFNPRPTDIYAA